MTLRRAVLVTLLLAAAVGLMRTGRPALPLCTSAPRDASLAFIDPAIFLEKLHLYPDEAGYRYSYVQSLLARGEEEAALEQVLWMIEHHPEQMAAGWLSDCVCSSYYRVRLRTAWRRQIALHDNDGEVLASAAIFFRNDDPFLAEELLGRAILVADSYLRREYEAGLKDLYEYAAERGVRGKGAEVPQPARSRTIRAAAPIPL